MGLDIDVGVCQAHFARNVLDKTPPALREKMQGALEDILHASSPEVAREAFLRITDAFSGQADRALRCLEEGFEDATAVLSLPAKYRHRLRTTNIENDRSFSSKGSSRRSGDARRLRASSRTSSPSVGSLEPCRPNSTRSGRQGVAT